MKSRVAQAPFRHEISPSSIRPFLVDEILSEMDLRFFKQLEKRRLFSHTLFVVKEIFYGPNISIYSRPGGA
jgi:hypothetical protein